jgi:hypothetical protein
MRDLPLPFSASMVKALLDGTKTQTRRLLNPSPERLMCRSCGVSSALCRCVTPDLDWTPCDLPRYRIGDRLYVRERITKWISGNNPLMAYTRFDADQRTTLHAWPEHWVRDFAPPMHMPKEFSRLTLKVTGVRVQQLQEITNDDAIAEGIERVSYKQCVVEHGGSTFNPAYAGMYGWRNYDHDDATSRIPFHHDKAALSYRSLWDEINRDRASWISNPWVAAYTFTVHKSNIDNLTEEGVSP